MTVRTRFAPSPTGYLHIGGVRTALFCWLYARRHGGTFVLRIEDTDRERSTPESIEAILEGMRWMELAADEGPFYQTRRMDRYRQVIDDMLADGRAYRCYCTREELEAEREAQRARGEKPRYSRRCREHGEPRDGVDPVIRFRNPLEGAVSWDDAVKGRITISNDELDDLIIARGDGSPTYNFCVVVDDLDMAITHVIRGDDHVNNTPRQINILRALGGKPPVYAHVPMILGPDGQRLSKRHGAVSVLEYRKMGILPEAMRNYLVRLGWSHGDQELFSDEEMIALFDIHDVNRAASSFDQEKLLWLNQHYIKECATDRLVAMLAKEMNSMGVDISDGPSLVDVVEALRERARTVVEMAEKSLYFFREFDDYDAGAAKKHLRPAAAGMLRDVRGRLAGLDDWRPETIHAHVVATAEDHEAKLGKLAQPIRVAVSGAAATPSIDVTLALVGKEKTLSRIDKALEFIDRRASESS
ncbi:MAG: glutamate--tRNA ligase [Proteobacteria bacterium]|nr:MAG: glutamate--tRNA ligase [Pseudomonadota bacterium]